MKQKELPVEGLEPGIWGILSKAPDAGGNVRRMRWSEEPAVE